MKEVHVQRVRVLVCPNSGCKGDEEGCNSSECRKPTWRSYKHIVFKDIYGRCPRNCKSEDRNLRS